jgi:hypothetical protein
MPKAAKQTKTMKDQKYKEYLPSAPSKVFRTKYEASEGKMAISI